MYRPMPTTPESGYRTLRKGHASKLQSDLIDHVFHCGMKGDIAVVGDWNGSVLRAP